MTIKINNLDTYSQYREVRTYGCTEEQLCQSVNHGIKIWGNPVTYAMSMISDAQELMVFKGDDPVIREDVRQTLNRAKWILSKFTDKDNISPR